MAEPFLGEIRLFANGYAPRGWAQCDGQILPIHQNQALYALIGNIYGGDGVTAFALPDLRGKVVVHSGGAQVGVTGGEEAHVLTQAEMPNHQHMAMGTSSDATARTAEGLVWGASENLYSTQANTQMHSNALGSVGQGQAHNNMQPYNVLNYCIALEGIFPSRN